MTRDNCATTKQHLVKYNTLSANSLAIRCYSVVSLASCGETFVASDKLQTFSTPSWPDNYPNNQNCYWIIDADGSGKLFELNVGQGQTEPNLDYVEVSCTGMKTSGLR